VATPTDLVELTWVFTLSRAGAAEDVAEFSINCHRDSVEPDDAGLLKLCLGADHAWAGHMPTSHWCDNVRLSHVRGRMFMANGHTLREQQFVDDLDWHGQATDPALPWETSLALSLYTYPRGSFTANARRKRGRIYLPPMAALVLDSSNSGYFSNANIATLLGELKTFMSHVGEDDLGVKVVDPGVYSRVDSTVRDVVQLSIDAKIDSQRRRQNRETAGHIEVSFP